MVIGLFHGICLQFVTKTVNHKLSVDTERWQNREYESRICNYCGIQKIGNEYYFLLVGGGGGIYWGTGAYIGVRDMPFFRILFWLENKFLGLF